MSPQVPLERGGIVGHHEQSTGADTERMHGIPRRLALMFGAGATTAHANDATEVGVAGCVLDEQHDPPIRDLEREDTYVTNVVKHFKWEAKGRRRLHKTPNRREIDACLPWLDAEIELIKPRVLICLGATAAKALLGGDFRVSRQRGEFVASKLAPHVTATIHPSAILRLRPDADRATELERFVADLRIARTALD